LGKIITPPYYTALNVRC